MSMTEGEFKAYKSLAAKIIESKIEDWDSTVKNLYTYKRRLAKDRDLKGKRRFVEYEKDMEKLRQQITYLDLLNGFFTGPRMALYSECCKFPDGTKILTDREAQHKEILAWAVKAVKTHYGYIYSEKEKEVQKDGHSDPAV